MKKNGMVEMSAATLNALKMLLFSNNEGVDLTNIVNDIAGKEESSTRDLTAINIGLAFKGITPRIDTATRYGDYSSWRAYAS